MVMVGGHDLPPDYIVPTTQRALLSAVSSVSLPQISY